VRDAWKEEAGAFTPYVGSSTLDASNLMMAIVGHRRRPQDARNDCCDVGGCIATAPTMESTARRRRGHFLTLYALAGAGLALADQVDRAADRM
jgi:hypothetical protein